VRRPRLGAQLGLAFAAVAAFTALLATIVFVVSWQSSFDAYVRARVQGEANAEAVIAASASQGNGAWSSDLLERMIYLAQEANLRVQLLDTHGAIISDTVTVLNPQPIPATTEVQLNQQGGPVQSQTATTAPMLEPVVTVPVYSLGVRVGSVRVASLSPGSFLTDQDVQFRSASTQGLALATVFAVVLASAAGILYSRVFTKPIDRVTQTAAALRGGVRGARTGMSAEGPVGVLGHTLDEMADSIQAEREFERRLTADVAHELRTPLQAIQATVEAMQDGVVPADGEHLGIVRNETVRMARLADSILELSRLENRSVQFRRSEIDPAVPLDRAVESHRALLDSLDLKLETDIAPDGVVNGDTDRLTQAFSNLVSNAARYTPEGGCVTVRLVLEPKMAVATVSDTGIGIPDEERERIFTRFWRSDAARERARSGFGIGLAVVREIVEQHGGSVGFRSNAPEPGTTFEVRLPLLKRRLRV
jgi:signal transduction histidine kinase